VEGASRRFGRVYVGSGRANPKIIDLAELIRCRLDRRFVSFPAMIVLSARLIAVVLGAATLLPDVVRADVLLPKLIGNVRPSSQLIPCDRAAEHLVIRRDSHLDPKCTYTGGLEITNSNVTLDCRGAAIDDPEGDDDYGIHVHAPASFRLSRVSVRNCLISGFLNNVRISRDGYRALAAGSEYVRASSRIEIRNSRLVGARGSGLFVNGYVTDVRVRDTEVAGSGGVGIYLEAGSKENRIIRSYIHDNGFGDVDPANGTPLVVGGIELRYLSTGREGLAINGSRDNYVAGNVFEHNSYGAIFLYKNCGEYFTERPQEWWPRRYGANGNRIRRNEFIDEQNGIWIGSRMSQNQAFLDCSDPSYFGSGILRIHEDFAKGNVIQSNSFVNVAMGIRVEDDGTRIERNRFESDRSDHVAILIGTGRRSEVLGRPVTGTIVRGNRAHIFLGQSVYEWVYEVDGLVFERNRSRGVPALIHQAIPPPTNLHLFVKELFPAP
jgi:hypothetical protein